MDYGILLQPPQLISVVKKVYISDSTNAFVNFSDQSEQKGTNRLISFGSIDTNIDQVFRSFYNKTGNITLRNNDRFFDKCFPYDPNKGWTLNKQDGIPANFRRSANNIINIFSNNTFPTRIRLTSEIQIPGFTPVEFVLGTFLFTAIETDLGSIATITTDSLIQVLQRKTAVNIKDGTGNWYRDVPIAFLIRKVLEKTFGVYNTTTYKMELPSGFIIPKFKDLTLLFDISQYSSLGRSPNQEDLDNDGEPDYFPNYGLIPRAMIYDSINKLLYCGLDNEIWKLDVDKTSNSYMIWTYYTSLASTRYIEKLQLLNGKLYVWSRDKWLHSGVDPWIEVNDTMAITDSMLREKDESLDIITISDKSLVNVYDEVVYDTEFNYFPSIPTRFVVNSLKIGWQSNSDGISYHSYSWLFSVCSSFGNINTIADYADRSNAYGLQEPTQLKVADTISGPAGPLDSISTDVGFNNFFEKTTNFFNFFVDSTFLTTDCIVGHLMDGAYTTAPLADGDAYTISLDTNNLKLNNVNLSIPFKQRLLVNCLGNKYSDSSSYGADQYSSIQFTKLRNYNDSQENVWGTPIEFGGNPVSLCTQIDAKNPSCNLDLGYYAGMASRYVNNDYEDNDAYYNHYTVPYSGEYKDYQIHGNYAVELTDPIWGIEGLEETDANDIKFTLGQKGVYGLFTRNGSSNPCQLRFKIDEYNLLHQRLVKGIKHWNYRDLDNIVKDSTNYQNALICNIGNLHSTNYGVDVPYPTLYLEEIDPADGSIKEIVNIKGLNYKGVEVQPTSVIGIDSTNYAWAFGYGVNNLNHFGAAFGDISVPDATSAYTNNYGGLALADIVDSTNYIIKQKCHLGFALKVCTDVGGFSSYVLTNSEENNKNLESPYYYLSTRFLVTSVISLAGLVGSIMKVTSPSGTWDLYIAAVAQNGNTWSLFYYPWGLLNAKRADVTKDYLPNGNFQNTILKIVATYLTPLENKVVLETIKYGNRIYATILNMLQIGSATQYSIAYADIYNPSAFTTIYSTSHQPKNFQLGASGKLYFTLEGSGKTAFLDLSLATDNDIENSYTEMANSDYAISGELYTHGDTALIEDLGENSIIYGFSSPSGRDRTQSPIVNGIGNASTTNGITPGKYNTWRLGTDYIPLAELADFSGMTCDQALDALTQAIYWTKGFDEFGNYFQLKRILEDNPSIILDADGNNKFIKISKKIDYASVANRISIVPYITTLALPSYQVTQHSTRLQRDALDLRYDIQQRDTAAKTIILNCVKGGALSINYYAFKDSVDSNITDWEYHLSYEDIKTVPLFAYSIVNPTIEGRVCVDAEASAITLYLDSVFGGNDDINGIHTGDYVTTTDATTNFGTLIRQIIAVDSTANSITLDSAFGIVIKATSIIFFAKMQATRFSNDYVTEVAINTAGANTKIAVISNENLGIGNIVEFSSTSTRAIIKTKDIDSNGQHWITIDSALTLTAGDIIKAYWSPMMSETGYEIGGSKVILTLSANNNATPALLFPYSFFIGESIVITCKGLTLSQDSYSTVTEIDVESSSLYGELEFQSGINNKFVNKVLAKFLAKSIIDDSSTPKYVLSCTLPYMPNMTPMSNDKKALRKIQVISNKLFPSHLDFAVDSGILDLKQQPDKRSTIVTLRGDIKL